MIAKILCGFFITFVLLALLSMVIVGMKDKMPLWSRFRKRKNLIAAERPPPPPMVANKNMIIAMAQRKIYNLKDNAACSPKGDLDNEQKHADEEWARRMIAESCAQLDQSQPNADFLCEVANKLCDQIEKMIDEYNNNLREVDAMLVLINRQNRAIEKQFSLNKEVCVPEETGTENDECFMMVFDQIVNKSV